MRQFSQCLIFIFSPLLLLFACKLMQVKSVVDLLLVLMQLMQYTCIGVLQHSLNYTQYNPIYIQYNIGVNFVEIYGLSFPLNWTISQYLKTLSVLFPGHIQQWLQIEEIHLPLDLLEACSQYSTLRNKDLSKLVFLIICNGKTIVSMPFVWKIIFPFRKAHWNYLWKQYKM